MDRLRGDRWFFHPTREVYADPADFDLHYESVFFDCRLSISDCRLDTPRSAIDNRKSKSRIDNLASPPPPRLHGWFFPAKGKPKGTVVHCHGNGGNITGHFKFVAWMPAHGWNVLCFDYQGFGRSEGRASRPNTIADTHAAIDYVRSRDDVDGSRIVLLGQSLGGAVAIVAAAGHDQLCGVAVEGAFSDYAREAAFVCRQSLVLWGVAPLVRRLLIASSVYEPIDHVAKIAPTPTFFITGTADHICEPAQTLDLHAAAGEPKSLWVIEGGGHTSALTETDGEGPRRLDAFFTKCVEHPAPGIVD